jgi:uncharacterized membrane protein YraQ (UPF0718 family)
MEQLVRNMVIHFGAGEGTPLEKALTFFIYDTAKIFLMLTTIIFTVAIIRTFFPPTRVKKALSRKYGAGNVAAASLGILTPFCTCSAIPMFIGFLESGVPLGVTLSFLIAAPLINEVALVLLWGLFGLKVALTYIGTGLIIAIVAGIMIGRFKMESAIEEAFRANGLGTMPHQPDWAERIGYAAYYTWDILKKIWYWIIIGISIGSVLHGYTPDDFLIRYAGPGNVWAVPIAVLIGVPLYASCGGAIPIAYVLLRKGMALGTVLAFVMAVTALSLPEMIILRRVMKPRLLGTFVGIVTVAIIYVGYLFNWLFT